MEEFLHITEHVLTHSLADTLYLIPILYITYVAMEWIEHKAAGKTQAAVQRAGAAGPFVGAVLGAVPQCGFSAMGATLYAGRVITLGTLYAVFLSTSDEMLPIFLAQQVPLDTILAILGTKLMIGMAMGFIVDAVFRVANRDKQPLRIHKLCEQDDCGCDMDCEKCRANPESVYQHFDDGCCECADAPPVHDHEHDHKNGWKSIFKSALKHTVQVMIFIFVITVALNYVLETVGEDALSDWLASNETFSVLCAALIGLIPNCAASIIIADLYIEGVLGAGAMMSGLLVSAGIGLLVLVRTNRRWRQDAAIIVGLWAMGVFWGLIINALHISFF